MTKVDRREPLRLHDWIEKAQHYKGLFFVLLTAGGLLQHPNAWIDDVHPDDRAVALASHQQVLSQGESECVYRIVRRHGGTLTVDSMPGAGATVRFTLPVPAHTPHAAPMPHVSQALAAPDETELA